MKQTKKTQKKTQAIGADVEDFEVEFLEVVIRRTVRERLVDALWTVTATVVAVTVATVFIIPMFG